ncbi:ABC transporter substrate-binding protein [Pontixanthobacter gangjinensis]|uniref:Peptide ABC transporter substrate-binding protein n=1 Tax=Pontixanthobacter gangjinensis TaxID=1028742 RepID=A0A6I4SJY4_9SPHN|nr:ABC transporter substrate-binding protein [Pontixanthobacter gangjinensis]MXO55486.1 peptide ABC transporter substrate-binding protein [Pontixanthobacter gangjinensis]
MARLGTILLTMISAVALAGCSGSTDDKVTRVAFIGNSSDIEEDGVRLSVAAQHLRAATAEGLVALNERGEIVPALAERWIITDDGMSYIFRLRSADWPDGTPLTGANVRAALERNFKQLDGTSLGLDLDIISDTRAMTGRVIEIRLKSPMPQFLQLLAQPELGLRRNGKGTGPMVSEIEGGQAILDVMVDGRSGLESIEDRKGSYRQIAVISAPADEATKSFQNDEADVVFNGRLLSLPLAATGPLTRGTVRLDIVVGLLGLQISNSNGLLASPARREALTKAIDRETLLESFAVGGWVPASQIVPAGLPSEPISVTVPWAETPILDRQADARRQINAWKNGEGRGQAKLTISLPRMAGSNLFFVALKEDFEAIGITLERVGPDDPSDLKLVDRIARYGDARWFLNQFNCSLKRGLCSARADALVGAAVAESDPVERSQLLAAAERALLEENVYIPLGAPVRWSLISGGVDGFIENPSGMHPLFPMALRPI